MRRNDITLLVALSLGLMFLTSFTPVVVGQSEDPISDLPFYGTVDLSCGWHINCSKPPAGGFDNTRGGIDLVMYKETVYSGGHGYVNSAGNETGENKSFGLTVRIDHDGTEALYAHLEKAFVNPGDNVCQAVAIGYSGNSNGDSGGAYHLHFGPSFTHSAPIFGTRPTSSYADPVFDYDPYTTPPLPRPSLSHSGVETGFSHKPVRRGVMRLSVGFAKCEV